MRKKFLFPCIIAILVATGCDSFLKNPLNPSGVNRPKNHNFNEVWLTPNVASKDMVDMFLKPDLWPVAKNSIDVYSFYANHLSGGNCNLCGPNTLEAFRAAKAIDFLNHNRIKIAMETPTLKPYNCNETEGSIYEANLIISNLRSMGGQMSYIAMDEPFTSSLPLNRNFGIIGGAKPCDFTIEQTVNWIKDYTRGVTSFSPGTKVGLIEAYPYFSAEQIKSFVIAMEQAGIKPPFLHIDFDPNYSGVDFSRDLQSLRSFCKSRGISFGVIIIGGDGTSNESATAGATLMARRIDETLGLRNQDHFLLQSWLDYPPTRNRFDNRLFPDNLPEDNPVTLTGLLNQLLGTTAR